MNFKRKHDYSSRRHISTESLVECIVDDAGYGVRGKIEMLSEQVQTLTAIVGWMARKLQKDDLLEMADHFGFEFCGEDQEGVKK